MRQWAVLAIAAVLPMNTSLKAQQSSMPTSFVTTGTSALLDQASKYELPKCRPGTQGKGVIVAWVITAFDGSVEWVKIDESSTTGGLEKSALSQSVLDSLNRWRFKVAIGRSGRPIRLRSRVYFYVDCNSVPGTITVPGLTDLPRKR